MLHRFLKLHALHTCVQSQDSRTKLVFLIQILDRPLTVLARLPRRSHMKKQRLVLYVEPQTLMVIEQLAAMEDSSVSAFATAYLDRIAKNNDENRVLLGMMPELKTNSAEGSTAPWPNSGATSFERQSRRPSLGPWSFT
jgi:hypothetical protein